MINNSSLRLRQSISFSLSQMCAMHKPRLVLKEQGLPTTQKTYVLRYG